tara:strand:- start:577 stop:813 length:237 start_codon:yes stop_codon:yes gene_type:complete
MSDTKDMTKFKAKKHLTNAQDYLIFTVVKDKIFVDYENNSSLNILGDLAVANKDFANYLEEVLRAIKNQKDEDAKGSD